MRQAIWIAVVLCGTGASAQGMQGAMTVAAAGARGQGSSASPAAVRPARHVEPFSMVQTETTTMMYPGGLVVRRISEVKTYRASDGRTRVDRQLERTGVGNGDPRRFWTISISDQTAGTSMSWSDSPGSEKAARVFHFSPLTSAERLPMEPRSEEEARAKPVFVRESLGEKTIQGITVKGMRTTEKFPEEYQGNNIEYSSVRETWLASAYGMALESDTDDPRLGHRVMTLVSCTPGEPDAALFEPPAGYKVIDPELPKP